MFRRLLVPLFVLVLSVSLTPLAYAYTVASPPAWVRPVVATIPDHMPEDGNTTGSRYILLNRQFNIEKRRTESFSHLIIQLLDGRGVEEESQVFISFAPAYQQLVLHFARIHRGNRIINSPLDGTVRIIQRETQIEQRMIDGKQTAAIIIEGTQPGDTIEYAYTIIGQNPVFQNRYMGAVGMGWTVPLQRAIYRWIVSNDYPLAIKAIGHSYPIKMAVVGDAIEYSCELKNVMPIISDGNLPQWYDPFPYTQLSQFESWGQVARWGASLYPVPAHLSQPLEKTIAAIQAKADTPMDRLLMALCLTQDTIRYLGIEIGTYSYAPTEPSEVFRRKFGDCKDKTLLLCTLLTHLGIEARPALVNTTRKRFVSELLPSPTAFNHVITRATIDGRYIWIDPTGNCPKLGADPRYQAGYETALVLDDTTTDLSSIPPPPQDRPDREVLEYFDMRNGIDAPTLLTVKTIHRQYSADDIRDQLNGNGRAEIAKNYLNFYAKRYPSITEREPLKIDTDSEPGAVIVVESYTIDDSLGPADATGRHTMRFHPVEINSFVRKPDTTLRTMPIGLSHPIYITEQTTVRLPEAWPVEPSQFTINNDAFSFKHQVTYAKRALTLSTTYQSKADHVPVGQAAQYLADLDAIDREMGFALHYGGPVANGLHPLGITAGIIGLVLAFWTGRWAYRYDPVPPAPDAFSNQGPAGIGGWLLLPAMAILVQPIRLAVGLVGMKDQFFVEFWNSMTPHPGMELFGKIAVIGEMAGNIILFALAVVLVILLVQRRTSVPSLFTVMIAASFIFIVADYAIFSALFDLGTQTEIEAEKTTARLLIALLIWGFYMKRSIRVRNTFLRRRPFKAPTATPETLPSSYH